MYKILISLQIYSIVPDVLIVDSIMQLSSNPRMYEFGNANLFSSYSVHINVCELIVWLSIQPKNIPQESSIFIINISV